MKPEDNSQRQIHQAAAIIRGLIDSPKEPPPGYRVWDTPNRYFGSLGTRDWRSGAPDGSELGVSHNKDVAIQLCWKHLARRFVEDHQFDVLEHLFVADKSEPEENAQ